MKAPTRRGLLKNAAAAAAAVTAFSPDVSAQVQTSPSQPVWEKKAVKRVAPPPTPAGTPPPAPAATAAPAAPKGPLFNSIITFGNLVFLAGIGAHFKGTIEEHTTHVLDELEQNLIAAGSSMDKVLKVNVYLSDLANYTRMNAAYAGRFGATPPVRTTVAVSGVPGESLVEIDCIASL